MRGDLQVGENHLIADRVCEDPQVRALWDRTADLRRHAYGTTRPMYLDGWRPRPAWVRIMGWQPMHEPSLRVITGEPAANPPPTPTNPVAAPPDNPPDKPGHGISREHPLLREGSEGDGRD